MASRNKKVAHIPAKARPVPQPRSTTAHRAQYMLCALWSVGTVLGLGTLVAQTAMGTYGEDAKEAWTLIAPLYVSVLSLLFGAIASGAAIHEEDAAEKRVRAGYFRSCVAVSALANLVYLGSLWMQPLMIASGAASSHIGALKVSLLWMLVVQGLVSIAMGGLFGSVQTARK